MFFSMFQNLGLIKQKDESGQINKAAGFEHGFGLQSAERDSALARRSSA
jgi:hypothetical protein